jgi:hypothetical protein
MATSSNHAPITQVDIAIHEVAVSITTQNAYPDQLDDMSNRALSLLQRILDKAHEQKIDVRRFNYSDFESDLEDEEEEAG